MLANVQIRSTRDRRTSLPYCGSRRLSPSGRAAAPTLLTLAENPNSWRLPPPDSLPSKLCGERVERGIPEKPFYANDLTPQEHERAQAICTEAGVRDESLLDACILDVTVLGTREAARVFARAHPPRAEIRVSSARQKP